MTLTSDSKKIIVIAGSTASGKTALSVSLAQALNCPIISADSRQFYKELSAGTAKPTSEEMKEVPHYFIDSHHINNPVSAGTFEKEGSETMEKLFQKNDFIIVVGGSGMFIDALIYGTDNIPNNLEIREKWNKLYAENGLFFLQEELKKADKKYFEEVDIKNPMRLIRALEAIEITQKPYSQLRQTILKKPKFNTFYFVVTHPRDILYERINRRVDEMIKNGLVAEAKKLLPYKHLQPLNTVGYSEMFRYFSGELSEEEAIEHIKRNTRRFAKRQLTWFRKVENAIWLNASDTEEDRLVKEILQKVRHK